MPYSSCSSLFEADTPIICMLVHVCSFHYYLKIKVSKYFNTGSNPGDVCTGNAWWGCQRTGNSQNILPPIQSARLRSSRGLNFKYGKVEIVAKMPTGDWLWPGMYSAK